jgi:hypothetical protein
MFLNDYATATVKFTSPKAIITTVVSPAKQNLLGRSKLEDLSQNAPKINKKALTLALLAYKKASNEGSVKKHVLTVIDYSQPSDQQRMYIFDMDKNKLLYKTYVAHGKNSGDSKVPTHFSNEMSSKKSSLGTFITEDTYEGHNGISLNLKGLDHGFNDKAHERRVVVHGAKYVEPTFIKSQGRAGRSWGCPAIAKSLAKPVINTIKNGSVVFSYYPDSKFLVHAEYALAA